MEVDSYLIKKSFSDLFIDNIKKRKYNEMIKGVPKITPKKKKLNADNIDISESENSTKSHNIQAIL